MHIHLKSLYNKIIYLTMCLFVYFIALSLFLSLSLPLLLSHPPSLPPLYFPLLPLPVSLLITFSLSPTPSSHHFSIPFYTPHIVNKLTNKFGTSDICFFSEVHQTHPPDYVDSALTSVTSINKNFYPTNYHISFSLLIGQLHVHARVMIVYSQYPRIKGTKKFSNSGNKCSNICIYMYYDIMHIIIMISHKNEYTDSVYSYVCTRSLQLMYVRVYALIHYALDYIVSRADRC